MNQNQNIGQVQEVVKVEDVIWKVDHLLNREHHKDFTGKMIDEAIDIILEEIKRCVQGEMPKYNIDFHTLVKGHILKL